MHTMYPSPKLSHAPSISQMATANDAQFRSMRNTQYSLRSFDVPVSSPRPAPTPDLGNLDGPRPQALSGQEWSDNFPGGKASGVFDQLISPYETDVSSGHNSSGPSPQASSSNTSYSPPSQNGDQPAVPSPGAQKALNFVDRDGKFVTTPSQQVNANFSMPSNWNIEAAAATPKANTTGLTPGPDGDWSQMIDNMSWDSTLINADTPQWNMSPGTIK